MRSMVSTELAMIFKEIGCILQNDNGGIFDAENRYDDDDVDSSVSRLQPSADVDDDDDAAANVDDVDDDDDDAAVVDDDDDDAADVDDDDVDDDVVKEGVDVEDAEDDGPKDGMMADSIRAPAMKMSTGDDNTDRL